MTNQERFLKIYKEKITREGSDKLLDFLVNGSDFFTAPASTRYHGAYEGGLLEHSLNVYDCLCDILARPRMKELYGVEDYDQFIRDHSALIIWSGSIEDMDITVEEPVYSLDILPTVSNLFGVEFDSRLLVGRDVFSEKEPLVLWPDFSWITDKGTYNAKTGEFTLREGQEADRDYIDYIHSQVANKIRYSESVQELDYFNYISKALGKKK